MSEVYANYLVDHKGHLIVDAQGNPVLAPHIIGAVDANTPPIATPERLAHLFHETYERLAPEYGYATRSETAIPWLDIPEDNPNKRLMIAVAGEVLKELGLA